MKAHNPFGIQPTDPVLAIAFGVERTDILQSIVRMIQIPAEWKKSVVS